MESIDSVLPETSDDALLLTGGEYGNSQQLFLQSAVQALSLVVGIAGVGGIGGVAFGSPGFAGTPISHVSPASTTPFPQVPGHPHVVVVSSPASQKGGGGMLGIQPSEHFGKAF